MSQNAKDQSTAAAGVHQEMYLPLDHTGKDVVVWLSFIKATALNIGQSELLKRNLCAEFVCQAWLLLT